jgi:hypothetical protein
MKVVVGEPYVHCSKFDPPMSALGQKQTSEQVRPMSALPPKADIVDAMRNVRFVPKADIERVSKWTWLSRRT